MFWRFSHRFLGWAPPAFSAAYLGVLTFIATAATANAQAKRYLDTQVDAMRGVMSEPYMVFWVAGLVAVWLAAFLWTGTKAETEQLRLAGKQVDRRKDNLEVWARKFFDPIYDELADLAIAVNAVSNWDAYPEGKEYERESLLAMKREIPSSVISEAIGLVEAQAAFLGALDKYKEESRDLHIAEDFGVTNIIDFPGYRAWRESDAHFADELRKLALQPNLGKVRAHVPQDWGRYDRDQHWPTV